MSPKTSRFTEKIAVALSPEQLQDLKEIAQNTGDTVSGILRRLAVQFIEEHKQKGK